MTEQSTVENRKTIPQIEVEISNLQTQISNLKVSVENKETQLENYRNKRAQLVLNEKDSKSNKAKVTSIDHEIKQLKQAIENAPSEIRVLKENLEREQKLLAHEKRELLLAEQVSAGGQVEDLSQRLVTILEHAMKINSKLLAASDRYAALKNLTGVETCSENICQGSREFLKVVYDYCSAELKGERPVRTQLPPPYCFI